MDQFLVTRHQCIPVLIPEYGMSDLLSILVVHHNVHFVFIVQSEGYGGHLDLEEVTLMPRLYVLLQAELKL